VWQVFKKHRSHFFSLRLFIIQKIYIIYNRLQKSVAKINNYPNQHEIKQAQSKKPTSQHRISFF
jgi:hypothetical protein